MLPKPVFMPSGGLFYLCLRYWPQNMLFIILMRFIDVFFICSIYENMSLDSLQPGLGPLATAHPSAKYGTMVSSWQSKQ